MIEAALAESHGPNLRANRRGSQIWVSQTQRSTQKSSDWESTNIGSKFNSLTDSIAANL